MRVIAVTSPATDAGKTFLAAGIAEAAARRGLKTLFLELDVAVGDAVRVFNLAEAARSLHPTVATWSEYPDLAAACLRAPSGTCVLPRPELATEAVSAESVESLLFAAKNSFDIVVADLGADCYTEYWAVMVRNADVAILVSDCDEKALVRVKRFLSSYCSASPPKKWILAVNTREKRGVYGPGDVARFLAGAAEIGGVVRIPYFPGAEKNPVKTFPPDDRFAEDILKVVMENGGGVLKEEELEKEVKAKLDFGFLKKLFVARAKSPPAQLAAELDMEKSGAGERDAFIPPPETPFPEPVVEAERAESPRQRTLRRPAVLLVGKRSESLAALVAQRGWEARTGGPDAPADAAVVDAELLPTLLDGLRCPAIGFSSGRLSDWFFAPAGGARVACTAEACLSLLVEVLGEALESRTVPSFRQPEERRVNIPLVQPVLELRKRREGFVAAFYSGAQGYQGKTALAINAAALLVERGLSVCAVDLDVDKAGLTVLCGFSEHNPPPASFESILKGKPLAAGPAGVDLVPAPLHEPGRFPEPRQLEELIDLLASGYDVVILDFGARIASPAVARALGACSSVFLVATPLRGALTAVARFRSGCVAEVGGAGVAAVINRVGVSGGISPRDAARILGFTEFFEVPEDPAVAEAEARAFERGSYDPPVLKRKSRIRPALLRVLDAAFFQVKEAGRC